MITYFKRFNYFSKLFLEMAEKILTEEGCLGRWHRHADVHGGNMKTCKPNVNFNSDYSTQKILKHGTDVVTVS